MSESQRSVLFDTETTGLDPATGDRVIEIAAIELIRDLPTGKIFHTLIDPQRDIPEDATRIMASPATTSSASRTSRRSSTTSLRSSASLRWSHTTPPSISPSSTRSCRDFRCRRSSSRG